MIATEHQEQVTLMEWASFQKHPALSMLFAIPNGGARHKAVAGKLKAEGVKAGVPDLMLAAPAGGYHGLFIEMKRRKGSTTRPEQRDWHERLTESGYSVRVCRGCDQAIAEILGYLSLGPA